jgi:hypothetical protein
LFAIVLCTHLEQTERKSEAMNLARQKGVPCLSGGEIISLTATFSSLPQRRDTRNPLDLRLSGAQSRYGSCEEGKTLLPLPVIEP